MTAVLAGDSHYLLRFEGLLFENMVFECLPGWEAEFLSEPRPPQGDGSYEVGLLGSDGRTLISVSPRVAFHGPRFQRSGLELPR